MVSEPNKKTGYLFVQGSILAAASVIVRLIGFVYQVPMTAILGDTAGGYYSNAYDFYNIALLLSSYSLPLAVSKLVSAREIQGQHANSRRVFLLALGFGAVVGSIATAVCYFGAHAYGAFIEMPGVIAPLQVLAPTILVFSVMGVIRGYFQGHNNMVPTAISQIIEQIVNAIVSVGASWWAMRHYVGDPLRLSYGAAGGTLGTLCGAVAAFLTLIVIYLIYHKTFQALVRMDRERAESVPERPIRLLHLILATVIPVVISQTVYQVSGILDTVMFSRIMIGRGWSETYRSTMIGIYARKYRLLTTLPVAVASAMGTAIVPGLTADHVRGRMDDVRAKVASAVKFNMIIAFPCAVGMSVLAGPILEMLFRDTNPVSFNMLTYGSIAIVLFALSTLTNGILQGINRMSIPVKHSAIALGVHLIALWSLLTFTDLAQYALVICNVLFALIVCVLNWRAVGRSLSYRQEVRTTFVMPAIAALLMGVFVYVAYTLLKNFFGVTVSCLSSIVLAVPVYFAALILLKGITKEELLHMPKGKLVVRVLTRLHLLR